MISYIYKCLIHDAVVAYNKITNQYYSDMKVTLNIQFEEQSECTYSNIRANERMRRKKFFQTCMNFAKFLQ